jgi:hypothetical protein
LNSDFALEECRHDPRLTACTGPGSAAILAACGLEARAPSFWLLMDAIRFITVD